MNAKERKVGVKWMNFKEKFPTQTFDETNSIQQHRFIAQQLHFSRVSRQNFISVCFWCTYDKEQKRALLLSNRKRQCHVDCHPFSIWICFTCHYSFYWCDVVCLFNRSCFSWVLVTNRPCVALCRCGFGEQMLWKSDRFFSLYGSRWTVKFHWPISSIEAKRHPLDVCCLSLSLSLSVCECDSCNLWCCFKQVSKVFL